MPLHGFIEPKKVLQSHSAFLTSVSAAGILGQCFVLDANGNHAEEQIYEYYYELAKLGGGYVRVVQVQFILLDSSHGERNFRARLFCHGGGSW
jgi:hypothetical protein